MRSINLKGCLRREMNYVHKFSSNRVVEPNASYSRIAKRAKYEHLDSGSEFSNSGPQNLSHFVDVLMIVLPSVLQKFTDSFPARRLTKSLSVRHSKFGILPLLFQFLAMELGCPFPV